MVHTQLGSSEDRERAANVLRQLDEQADAIIVSTQMPSMSREQVELARGRLRVFKGDLESHLNHLNRLEREGGLSTVEELVLLPAIRGCSANLQVRVNSRPGPKWASNVSYCAVDLSYALHQLSGAPATNRVSAARG